MSAAEFILGLVTLQRAGELILSHSNTRRLMARGAVEVAPRHYPLMVAVHAAWLISLWVFGHDQPLHVMALAFYLVLQGLRFWVMRTLGRAMDHTDHRSARTAAGIERGPIGICRIPIMRS